MTAPNPEELSARLNEEVNAFVVGVSRLDDYDRIAFNSLMRDLEDLSRYDAATASLFKAQMYGGVGQEDQFERWVRNAEHLGARDKARIQRFLYLGSHGYASRALALGKEMLRHRSDQTLMHLGKGVSAVGGHHLFVSEVDAATARSEVLQATDAIEFSRQMIDAMDELGVSDEQLAELLDLAGEAMRRERLHWAANSVDISARTRAQNGVPALTLDYRVNVTPRRAAEMSWALAQEVVRRGLDTRGVVVGFYGLDLAGSRAAA